MSDQANMSGPMPKQPLTPAIDEAARQRIAELRAQRFALEQARNDRESQASATEQLAAEERGLLDDQALDAAIEKHGPVGQQIALVKTRLGTIILKRSNATLFKRYIDKGKFDTDDLDKLTRPCLVHPTVAEFDRIILELPATLTRCADRVAVLAGFRKDEIAGK